VHRDLPQRRQPKVPALANAAPLCEGLLGGSLAFPRSKFCERRRRELRLQQRDGLPLGDVWSRAPSDVLATNSPQGPLEEGPDEKKRLEQAMELAGLEPATSWVRLAPGSFGPDRLGLFR
jgi:hypothetical protein